MFHFVALLHCLLRRCLQTAITFKRHLLELLVGCQLLEIILHAAGNRGPEIKQTETHNAVVRRNRIVARQNGSSKKIPTVDTLHGDIGAAARRSVVGSWSESAPERNRESACHFSLHTHR